MGDDMASSAASLFDDIFGSWIKFARTYVIGAQIFGLIVLVVAGITIVPVFLWLFFQLIGLIAFTAVSLAKWIASTTSLWEGDFDVFMVPQQAFVFVGGAYSVLCLGGALIYAVLRWVDPMFERRSHGPLDIVRNNMFFRNGAIGALASAPFLSLAISQYFPQLRYFAEGETVTWLSTWIFWMQESQTVITLGFPGIEGFRFSTLTIESMLAAYHVWAIKVICYTEIAARFVTKYREIDARGIKMANVLRG